MHSLQLRVTDRGHGPVCIDMPGCTCCTAVNRHTLCCRLQTSTTTKNYLIDYDKTESFVVYDGNTMVRLRGRR